MRELYVKWRGRAHAHCAWVPEAAVAAAARRAPQLLRRLKAFRQQREDSVRRLILSGSRVPQFECVHGCPAPTPGRAEGRAHSELFSSLHTARVAVTDKVQG